MSEILITGSSGMMGIRLFEETLRQGHDVKALTSKRTGGTTPLNDKMMADLLESDSIRRIPRGVKLTVHLVANARVYEL